MSDGGSSHETTIRLPYLRLIGSGVKTVEVPVGYPRMRKIRAGDRLTFASADERVPTGVKRVTEYQTFDAMLDREDGPLIRGELGENRDDLLAILQSIPSELSRPGSEFSAEIVLDLPGYVRLPINDDELARWKLPILNILRKPGVLHSFGSHRASPASGLCRRFGPAAQADDQPALTEPTCSVDPARGQARRRPGAPLRLTRRATGDLNPPVRRRWRVVGCGCAGRGRWGCGRWWCRPG